MEIKHKIVIHIEKENKNKKNKFVFFSPIRMSVMDREEVMHIQ